jgi:hypothetical protein
MGFNLPLKLAIFASGRRQGDIAAAAGINASRLAQIARGRVTPSERERDSIATALCMPAAVLFSNDEKA